MDEYRSETVKHEMMEASSTSDSRRRHRPLHRQRSNSFRLATPPKPTMEDKLGSSLSLLDLEDDTKSPLPPIRLVDYSRRRGSSEKKPGSGYTRDEIKLANSMSMDEEIVNLPSQPRLQRQRSSSFSHPATSPPLAMKPESEQDKMSSSMSCILDLDDLEDPMPIINFGLVDYSRRRRSALTTSPEMPTKKGDQMMQDSSSGTNSTASTTTMEESSLSTVQASPISKKHRPLFRQRSNSFRLAPTPKLRLVEQEKLGSSLSNLLDDMEEDEDDAASPAIQFRVRRRSGNPHLGQTMSGGGQTEPRRASSGSTSNITGSAAGPKRASAQRRRASMAGSFVPPPTYWGKDKQDVPLPALTSPPPSPSSTSKTAVAPAVLDRRPKWSKSSSCSHLEEVLMKPSSSRNNSRELTSSSEHTKPTTSREQTKRKRHRGRRRAHQKSEWQNIKNGTVHGTTNTTPLAASTKDKSSLTMGKRASHSFITGSRIRRHSVSPIRDAY